MREVSYSIVYIV